MTTLIKDLLTENRFWTFWKSDYSERINVQWNGKTKFPDIIKEVEKKFGKKFMYERNIAPEKIDLTFD